MYGWWQAEAPIATNNTQVKATTYLHEGETALLVLATFLQHDVEVSLDFLDWGLLGLDPDNVVLRAPTCVPIRDGKDELFAPTDTFKVSADSGGWILLLELKN